MEPAAPPFEPETFYHVYHAEGRLHANSDENLFRTEENYRYFLRKYAEHVEPVAETYAYCLMPNHFHLLIRVRDEEALRAFAETKKSSFVDLRGLEDLGGLMHRCVLQQFKNLLNGYAKAYNKRYDRKGHLFKRGLGRKPILDDRYLTAVIRYVHHNPAHHGFVADPHDWPHSSYHALVSERPTRLARAAVLNWFGGRAAFQDAHARETPLPLDFENFTP